MGKERTKPSGNGGSVSALETQMKEMKRNGETRETRERTGEGEALMANLYKDAGIPPLTRPRQFVHTHAGSGKSSGVTLNDRPL